MNTISLTEQIGRQTGIISNGNGGGSNNGGTGGVSSGGPVNTPVTRGSSYKQDLVGNQTAKNNISRTPLDYLKEQRLGLAKLADIDTKYLASLDKEKAHMDQLNQCYQSVVQDYPLEVDAAELVPMKAFYDNFYASQVGEDSPRATIQTEQTILSDATTYTLDTTTRIKESNSSDEILELFESYLAKAKDSNWPEGTIAAAKREGQYTSQANMLKESLAGQADPTDPKLEEANGRIFQMGENCKKFRRAAEQREAAREAARNGGYGG